jgi:two-component system NtrC family sensor kinase
VTDARHRYAYVLIAGMVATLAVVATTLPTAFLPHGVCYNWNPSLIGLHLVSDGLIGAAYFSIPPALYYFAKRRGDLPFPWMFLLFALFIVACGATHWMEVWTLWSPQYWLAGALKAFTAAASVPTAVTLILLLPRALALPSPEQLRRANESLALEVDERKHAEERLR